MAANVIAQVVCAVHLLLCIVALFPLIVDAAPEYVPAAFVPAWQSFEHEDAALWLRLLHAARTDDTRFFAGALFSSCMPFYFSLEAPMTVLTVMMAALGFGFIQGTVLYSGMLINEAGDIVQPPEKVDAHARLVLICWCVAIFLGAALALPKSMQDFQLDSLQQAAAKKPRLEPQMESRTRRMPQPRSRRSDTW